MTEPARHGNRQRRGETIAEAHPPGHVTETCHLTLSVWGSPALMASLVFKRSTARVNTSSNSSYALSSREEGSEVALSISAEELDDVSLACSEEVPRHASEADTRTS